MAVPLNFDPTRFYVPWFEPMQGGEVTPVDLADLWGVPLFPDFGLEKPSWQIPMRWSSGFWGYAPTTPGVPLPILDNSLFYGGTMMNGMGDAAAFNPFQVGAYMAYHVQMGERNWPSVQSVMANEFSSLMPGAPKSEEIKAKEKEALAQAEERYRTLAEQAKALQEDNEKLKETLRELMARRPA